MKSGKIAVIGVFGALALSVASSKGQYLGLTGTVEGSLTGQTLFNSGTSANDGMVSSWVVSDSGVNSGGYVFIYQFENGGPDDITGINFNSFAGINIISAGVYSNVEVNATFLPTPTSIFPPNGPDFSYDTVTEGGAATFDGDLAPQQVSWFLVLETGSTSLNTGYALSQDNFQAHGEIYAPNFAVFAVPEPSSGALIMLLSGIAGFYAIVRWRRTMDG